VSQREITTLAKLLSDPENQNRSAEEIAQLIIDELDSLRATSHRLAVVGQVTFGPENTVHTVVLGPFRSPLQLKDQERFEEALKRPCTAARDAGRHLAWDSKTGTGSGRFMLAPAFMKPRDAWDFFRPPKNHSGDPMNLLVPPPPHIAETVERWRPGLWAEELGKAT
jgi:hypothetical protein